MEGLVRDGFKIVGLRFDENNLELLVVNEKME
jgi:hypothetical protein